jgi:hypothetical protein
MFEDELRASRAHVVDLERMIEHGFGSWFRNYVSNLFVS